MRRGQPKEANNTSLTATHPSQIVEHASQRRHRLCAAIQILNLLRDAFVALPIQVHPGVLIVVLAVEQISNLTKSIFCRRELGARLERCPLAG